MTSYNYYCIEELLLRLLGCLASAFAESEKKEVQDFVDAGEYGLALETLVDIVSEEDKRISGEALSLVHELAGMMQLDKETFEERLRNHVIDG